MSPRAPHSRDGFNIALICALPLEADLVQAVFDKFWEDEGRRYGKAEGDLNEYTTGVVGEHNVVLAYSSGMGKVNAAALASNMKFSFKNIELALVVGICGGVPFNRHSDMEMILGDVVVSTALVQYDFGREYTEVFRIKDTLEDALGRANPETRALLAKLATTRYKDKVHDNLAKHLAELQSKRAVSQYLGASADRLYESSYAHNHQALQSCFKCDTCEGDAYASCEAAQKQTCDELKCDEERLIPRDRLRAGLDLLGEPRHVVHFGKIASGDRVMKSGLRRDQIAAEHDVIAFEMEGAGVWEYFPSIVVKAICDYSDCHKNKVWQKYAAATAACCAKAILQQRTTHVTQLSGICYGLSNQTSKFVGRVPKIEEVEAQLLNQGGPRKAAIFGLGGAGKSRLAWEVANRARSTNPALSVFWLQANDTASLEKEYLGLASLLRIPGYKHEHADVREIVHRYLCEAFDGEWLIVLDDIDYHTVRPRESMQRQVNTRAVLKDQLPMPPNGFLLATTRNRQMAIDLAGYAAIEIGEMSPTEAVATLQSVISDSWSLENLVATNQLVEQLAYLPLALVQAASYMNMSNLTSQDYLDLFEEAEKDALQLLLQDFEDENRCPRQNNAVITTLMNTFERLRNHHQPAFNLLLFMACLSHTSIPKSLLLLTSSKTSFVNGMAALQNFSFVRKQDADCAGEPIYKVHRLVRLLTREWLKAKKLFTHWSKIAIRASLQLFHSYQYRPWDQTRTLIATNYIPHIQTLCASGGTTHFPQRWCLQTVLAQLMIYLDHDPQSCQLAESAALKLEQLLGNSHRDTLVAFSVWGRCLALKRDWHESASCLERCYRGFQELLGPRNEDLYHCVNDLAYVYSKLARFNEAEKLLLQSMKVTKAKLGSDSIAHLASLSQWAMTLRVQGRFKKAIRVQNWVLEKYSRSVRPDDLHLLRARMSLASIHVGQGKLSKAQSIYIDVAEAMTRVLGGNHPWTLECLRDLGDLYRRRGMNEEAERTLATTIQTAEKVRGPSSDFAIECKQILARVYKDQGRYASAEVVESQCNYLLSESRGSRDTRVASIRASLAMTKWHLGQRAQSLRLIKAVAAQLGGKPFAMDCLPVWAQVASLAEKFHHAELLSESLELYDQAIPNFEIAPNHERTLLKRCKKDRTVVAAKLNAQKMTQNITALKRDGGRRRTLSSLRDSLEVVDPRRHLRSLSDFVERRRLGYRALREE